VNGSNPLYALDEPSWHSSSGAVDSQQIWDIDRDSCGHLTIKEIAIACGDNILPGVASIDQVLRLSIEAGFRSVKTEVRK